MSAPARADFVAVGEPRWRELDALIARASTWRRIRVLSPDQVRRFARLHRSASADLAVARAAFPGDPLALELEQRIGRSGPLLYDRAPRSSGLREFTTRTYWRLVAERPALLAMAWGLMIGPAVAVALWSINAPERANLLLGGRFQGRTSAGDLGLGVAEQTKFASEIFVNNIRVSILVFALGITCCIGSAWLLVFNGAMLGVAVGTSISDGYGSVVLALIAGHGVLELSIIVVAAVAGMRIGMAIIRPGNEPRRRVVTREAQSAVMIVLGTMPFFVLAGVIEGFFTPAGFGVTVATIVGVLVGGSYWMLVWRLGFRPLRAERYARVAVAAMA